MTRPVYEPTPSRWSSALDYGSQQLFRRPSPSNAGTGIEWFQVEGAQQSLSTTWTEIDMTGTGAFEDGEYDTNLPTFDVDTDGRLDIRKDGAYVIYMSLSNLIIAPGVDTVQFTEVVRDSGPGPAGLFGVFGGETVLAIRRLNSGTPDVAAEPFPQMVIPFVIKNGDYQGTPLEMYFNAYIEEDGVGVAHTCVFNMMIFRNGSTFLS